MTTNTNTAGAESAAIRHVRDSFLVDIARRDQMVRQHTEAAAQLCADNAIDAVHAEVAAALIEQINADALAAAWAPVNEIDAAALVADHVLIAGMPRTGKAGAARALLLAALHDAVTDITVTDSKAAALLSGAGDLAALDGISTGTGADR
jgi:hypothetical protein